MRGSSRGIDVEIGSSRLRGYVGARDESSRMFYLGGARAAFYSGTKVNFGLERKVSNDRRAMLVAGLIIALGPRHQDSIHRPYARAVTRNQA